MIDPNVHLSESPIPKSVIKLFPSFEPNRYSSAFDDPVIVSSPAPDEIVTLAPLLKIRSAFDVPLIKVEGVLLSIVSTAVKDAPTCLNI